MNDYKEGFTGENDVSGSKIENPKPDSNTPYGAGTFSSPAEVEQEEANAEEEDDDEVKPDNGTELATQGQGPPDTSNTLTR
jgi:hypothetical protein